MNTLPLKLFASNSVHKLKQDKANLTSSLSREKDEEKKDEGLRSLETNIFHQS